MTELNDKQRERLDRIVDKIINKGLTHEQKLAITHRDGKVMSLCAQHEKAKENNNFLSMQIIHRQIAARMDEVLSDWAGRRIKELVDNGDIIFYMDEDQRDRYNSLRGRVFLLMDVLDTAFLDMSQLLDENGIPCKVSPLPQIREARKSIDKWSQDTIPVLKTKAAELAGEESDRVYEYISERTEVLNRKANRLLEKLEKQ